MSYQNTSVSHLCRIKGLTSEAGKKRNGSAARVNNISSARQLLTQDSEKRNPVSIDGFAGPISIKNKNIEPVETDKSTTYEVGIGRGTIRDNLFNATLVHRDQLLDRIIIHGEAARSKGNLAAVELLLKKHNAMLNKKQSSKTILLKLTDLNLARAFNRVAMGETKVKLASPLQKKFQQLQKKFSKIFPDIFVKYEPHRLSEDQFGEKEWKLGPQRYNAVLNGTYSIYPCPLKQYLDAHEVRYSDTTTDFNQTSIYQDIYLDYGKEEATQYAKNVVALDEVYRLYPKILAQVDPQAFWSTVLWFDDFLETLKGLQIDVNEKDTLLKEWTNIGKGRAKSVKTFNEYTGGALSKGPEENWGIQKKETDDMHIKLATDYAIFAYHVVSLNVAQLVKKGSNIFLAKIDYYKGTELDKYISGQREYGKLMAKEAAKNGGNEKDIPDEKSGKLLRKAMKSVGLETNSPIFPQDPEKKCTYCKKTSSKKLFACAKCEGAFYCDAKCQKADWKQHRNTCSRVLVQLQKQLGKLTAGGPKVESSLYKYGSTSLPTQPSMFSEVSGVGTMYVKYNPGGQSFINFGASPYAMMNGLMMNDLKQSIQMQKQMFESNRLQFKELRDLPPLIRFTMSCGVLPDLNTAKDCVSDAIAVVRGNLENLCLPMVGFTALEFAAKKGNTEIVKWLCTDDRTKGLVQIGCPIGWGLYTGQVGIARILVEHGADPTKTDVLLFNHTPTLMVAAENGKLEAMKFLVQECGVDIAMLDDQGKNVLDHITSNPGWRELDSHKECHKWAKKLLNKR